MPTEWGGAGLDYVSYVAGDRGDRARPARRSPSRCRAATRSSPSSIAHAGRDQQGAVAAASWPPARPSARSRCRSRRRHGRREPADRRGEDGGGYRITGRKVWVANAEARRWRSCSRARGPGCAGRASRRFSCRWTRPASRGPPAPTRSASAASAAWISSSTSPSATTRCSGRSISGFRLAMWALQGGRVAIAAQALGIGEAAHRRSARLRESSAKRSASRSPTTRRSSGCWPTWRPSSRRRGC